IGNRDRQAAEPRGEFSSRSTVAPVRAQHGDVMVPYGRPPEGGPWQPLWPRPGVRAAEPVLHELSCDVSALAMFSAISARLQFQAVLSRAVEAQVMRLTRGERRCLDRHGVLPTNEDEMKKTL